MKQTLLTAMLLANVTWLAAQYRDIPVKGAQGEWTVSNITPEEATEKALVEAKINALRKSGVEENVSSMATLFSDNDGQAYAEISTNETRGTIIDFAIVEQKPEIITMGGTNMVRMKVTIDATVRIYEKSADPSFAIKIKGIKAVYAQDATLSFSVTPNKKGYLKIFVFEHDHSGALLYPNSEEPNRLCEAGRQIDFPTTNRIIYRLTKHNPLSDEETNRLIVAYTKDDVPYMNAQMDFHSVLNWLARISPDRQTARFVQYRIIKNQRVL